LERGKETGGAGERGTRKREETAKGGRCEPKGQ